MKQTRHKGEVVERDKGTSSRSRDSEITPVSRISINGAKESILQMEEELGESLAYRGGGAPKAKGLRRLWVNGIINSKR